MEPRPLDGYPPLPRTSEWEGARIERGAPCACGGWINLALGENVQQAVWAHNQSDIHRAWRNLRIFGENE